VFLSSTLPLIWLSRLVVKRSEQKGTTAFTTDLSDMLSF
jgi:hypothetical protein